MNDWYCELSGELCGPMSFDELVFLKEREKLGAEDAVRQGKEGPWQPAQEVPRLFHVPQAGPQAAVLTRRPKPQPEEIETHEPVGEEDLAPPEPDKPSPPPAPRKRKQKNKQVLIGSGIGAAIALLLLLLLLLLFWPHGEEPGDRTASRTAGGDTDSVADGIGSGGDGGIGSGDGPGIGDGAANGGKSAGAAQGDGSSQEKGIDDDSQSGGGPTEEPSRTRRDAPPTTKPVVKNELTIDPIPKGKDLGSGGTGDGDGRLGDGGGGSGVDEFLGVKVKGKIALVCDVSGSMSHDFPVLVRELRKKFPKNTPIILIGGCVFSRSNPNAPPPQKLIDTGQGMPYLGIEFDGDEHVYMGYSTTDAIIFAVEKLKRDTVMFNNDLQDGGSEQSIDALEALRKKQRFTLSGRSLNRNAPARLLQFIEASGGDFKVDPISRTAMPAVPWGP
jgi:hypothetical protein